MRAGTTSLAILLDRHCDISLPPVETYYFSVKQKFDRGHAWYANRLRPRKRARLLGEKCASYGYIDAAAPRIADTLPDAKLIWILRNPIERTYSNYLHNLRNGTDTAGFGDAIRREMEGSVRNPYFRYLARSRYVDEIRRFRGLFSADQIHILLLESLLHSPEKELRALLSFLDVPVGDYDFEPVHENAARLPLFPGLLGMASRFLGYGTYSHRLLQVALTRAGEPPSLDKATREFLRDLFAEPNQELAAMCGIDLGAWQDPAAWTEIPSSSFLAEG